MTEKILEALSNVIDPDLHKDLVSLGMIQNLTIEGDVVSFTIILTTPACPLKSKFVKDCTDIIHKQVDQNLKVNISFISRVAQQRRVVAERLSKVKNLVAIASGKGGVGKSTVAVNLAVSLANMGAKVGLLDADINGPSLSVMLGLEEVQPYVKQEGDKSVIQPIVKFGIKIMSIGMLVARNQPLVWRGPMLSNAFQQLVVDTEWGELDYLIIDLPPGTGDIHLTLCQQLPLGSAIMVTTPQKVAVADNLKTIEMFRMDSLKIPVIGVVENMSYFIPLEHPEEKYYIFGSGGGKELSETYQIPLLGSIPFVMGVSDQADQGIPAVAEKGSLLNKVFNDIAQGVAQQISILSSHK